MLQALSAARACAVWVRSTSSSDAHFLFAQRIVCRRDACRMQSSAGLAQCFCRTKQAVRLLRLASHDCTNDDQDLEVIANAQDLR